MSLISDGERQDYERAINKAGLSVGDFVLTENEEQFPTTGIGPTTGIVTVTYMPTNRTCEYRAGSRAASGSEAGSSWSMDFETDLKRNMFRTC